jgi:hypothetical protein
MIQIASGTDTIGKIALEALVVALSTAIGLMGCSLSPSNTARLNRLLSGDAAAAITIVPNGTNGKVFEYGSADLGTCDERSNITSTGPLPDSGSPEAEVTGAYAAIESQDSTFFYFECNYSYPYDTQIVEFYADVSTLSLSEYSTLTIDWVGRAGVYATGAGCTYGSLAPDDAGTPAPEVDLYDPGSGTWVTVGDITATSSIVSGSFSTPSYYSDGGKIWVRAIGGESSSTFSCSTVQADYVAFTLQ